MIQEFNEELKELDKNLSGGNFNRKIFVLERITTNQMDIEDYAGAEASLTKAIEMNPATSVAENLFKKRAKAKKAMGDMEGYEADITESLWVDRREKLQLL